MSNYTYDSDLSCPTVAVEERKTVDIPISAAKKIALDYGYDQIIIIGRKCGRAGREHCTTYGVDEKHCSMAARIGNFLKYKVMGWTKENSATQHEVKPCQP